MKEVLINGTNWGNDMGKIKIILGASILLLVSVQVNAAIVTFDDRSEFITSTGATSATGVLPSLGDVNGSVTLGSVTISLGPFATRLLVGGVGWVSGGDWTALNPGNDIAVSEVESINVDFASQVFSAGFDFVEPNDSTCRATCFDSTFDVTLKNAGAIVDSFSFNAPDNVLAFIGVWSDMSFDRMEIVDATATIDNEYYGQFYSGTSPLPVPVPAAIDIKPGSDPNPINPKSKGVIPVAVLGSEEFYAPLVNFSTVEFGPGKASPVHDGHVEDVNGDGFDDMVFHFKTQETGIVCGNSDATLTGETTGGPGFTGTDTVKTVGCNASKQDTSIKGKGAMSWIFLLGLSVLGLWRQKG